MALASLTIPSSTGRHQLSSIVIVLPRGTRVGLCFHHCVLRTVETGSGKALGLVGSDLVQSLVRLRSCHSYCLRGRCYQHGCQQQPCYPCRLWPLPWDHSHGVSLQATVE